MFNDKKKKRYCQQQQCVITQISLQNEEELKSYSS